MPLPSASLLAPTGPAVHLHGCRGDLWPAETERPTCAVCLQRYPMQVVLDLGEQPLANALLDSPDQECRKFPLQLAECTNCGHVQLSETVRPDLMFDQYVYRTGISGTMRRHFAELAEWLMQELRPGAVVCEVGCNDGTLLKALRTRNVEAYGVDPSSVSENIEGERIVRRYFNERQAEELRSEFGPAQCVVMTNVLAHCPQPRELIRGAWELLNEGGLLVIEFPYVRDMVANLAFDTIYHEHGHYFGVKDLLRLLIGKFWKVEVERLPKIHSGSLRVTARKTKYTHLPLWRHHDGWQELDGNEEWQTLLTEEVKTPIDWASFGDRVSQRGDELRDAISGAGEAIGLYAPAKATVLLNHYGIKLARVIDDTPEKRGKFIPGVGTPIVGREAMGNPDAAVLLACNFLEEARAHETSLAGKVICPLPDLVRC